MSDVSNQSEVSPGSSGLAELDAGTERAETLTNLQRTLQGFGMGPISIKRKSPGPSPSPTTVAGGPTSRRPDWERSSTPGAIGLGHIPEAEESRVAVDTEMREISLNEPLQSRVK